jgi:hypothetical protein
MDPLSENLQAENNKLSTVKDVYSDMANLGLVLTEVEILVNQARKSSNRKDEIFFLKNAEEALSEDFDSYKQNVPPSLSSSTEILIQKIKQTISGTTDPYSGLIDIEENLKQILKRFDMYFPGKSSGKSADSTYKYNSSPPSDSKDNTKFRNYLWFELSFLLIIFLLSIFYVVYLSLGAIGFQLNVPNSIGLALVLFAGFLIVLDFVKVLTTIRK